MKIWKDLSTEEVQEYKQWANDNYIPGTPIDALWHPVIREECAFMNQFMNDNFIKGEIGHIDTTKTEYKAFIEMVKEMRSAQKQYFSTRDIMVLKLSKALEKQVDDAIDKKSNDNQQNLFQ